MRWLSILGLMLMWAGPGQAGDLGIAGAVSEAGQSLQQGLATVQAGLIQQELMREQHRLEMERLERQEQRARQLDAAHQPIAKDRSPLEQERTTKSAEQQALARVVAAQTAMTQRHPDWQLIVGAPNSQTPFRQWLASQPASYQQLVGQTWDPDILSAAIDQFKAHAKR